MALTALPKIPAMPSLNSPYLYGGNQANTDLASATSPWTTWGGKPVNIGGYLPSQAPKVTFPQPTAQVAKNTTGYPIGAVGGGPTQTPYGGQTSLYPGTGSYPSAPAAAPVVKGVDPKDVQAYMLKYMNDDAIRVGQV